MFVYFAWAGSYVLPFNLPPLAPTLFPYPFLSIPFNAMRSTTSPLPLIPSFHPHFSRNQILAGAPAYFHFLLQLFATRPAICPMLSA